MSPGAVGGGVRHLYVHLPFCAHRCGYCDFVTLVGRAADHGRYVDALLAELELERAALAPRLETIFLGGGTPTFTAASELARLLTALPAADEVTVEGNPETVTPELAPAPARARCDACLARRAELPSAPARGLGAPRRPGRRPTRRLRSA